ncbi:MAG TPA: T9SS type A sorting domain-containing protein [Flavobacteriales bacterium]|nr:T9SS type A sorting domain-containing protein [Flavobacteriales bacterium]
MRPLQTIRSFLHRSPAILAGCALPALLAAQVSLYEFSQSVEPYTEITEADGGYALGVATYWPPLYNQRAWVNTPFYEPDGQVASYLNPAVGPGYPIGFDFTFNGDVFDVIGVSHSGWISFGKSSDGNQAVWIYAIDHPHGMPFVQYIGGPDLAYKRNRVAGWGNGSLYMQDMSPYVPPGPTSSLRIATIGTAPNRVCVIQWHAFLNAYPPSSSRINFQIRLNEADNSVDVRYGTIIISTILNATVQVGLGGRVPEDFNSRKTVYEQPAFLYDWNITVPGTLNTDGCYATSEQPGHPNGTGIPPAEGLNFKWSPPFCPPPAWPLTIDQMSFDSGHASWEPTAAGEYEYYLTDTNDIGGPEIASGITTDPEAYLFGLEPSTTYYLFIRSLCAGEPGEWSLATPVETLGGGMVACDGTVLTEDFCSEQYSVKEWLYISSDGSPLKIEFLGGLVGNTGTESFQVWDGTSPSGTPAPAMSGNLAGYSFTASSGALFIRLVTDAGACAAQSWYLPLQWRVGCKNCQDPLASFNVVEDCDNHQYFVNVNIFNMGSSASLSLNNNLGLPSTTASATGPHNTGPFPAGQTVIVTAQNPDNPMCYAASPVLINAPCAVQDCGPTTYTHCYDDHEMGQWAYQGENGQEIGVRFIRGTVGLGDHFFTYNGLDIENLVGTEITAGYQTAMANKLFTSGPPSTDHAIVMELIADDAVSCVTEDPLFGAAQEWEFVVACYDGCVQPKATFTTACVSTTQYEILVNITDIGSTASVQITNNGGAATVNATATGTYHVGPFNAGTPVTVEVVGASILCTWTASGLVKDDCSTWAPAADCEGTPGGTALPGTPCTTDQGEAGSWNDNCVCVGPDGINEGSMGSLRLFPNPSSGLFTLEIPGTMAGSSVLRVRDITGRTVAVQQVHGTGLQQVDLQALPAGYYTLTVENNSTTVNGKISIR